LPDAPARSRYDFVLRSADAALWVANLRPRGKDFELALDSRVDTGRWIEVTGTLQQGRGLQWLDADPNSLKLAKAPSSDPVEDSTMVRVPAAPAPEVIFSKEWLGRVEPGKALREPDFVFEALVRPASGQQVEVTVELNGRKVFSRVIDEPARGDDPNVRASLRLAERPGKDGKTPNEIVFVARNRGVLPGYESYEEVRRVFTLPHIPTAVLVCNNQMTMGTLAALRDLHLVCPQQVSLIGFDDFECAGLVNPPVTMVRQPAAELGAAAAKAVLKRIRDPKRQPCEHVVLPTQLVVRESTASPVNGRKRQT